MARGHQCPLSGPVKFQFKVAHLHPAIRIPCTARAHIQQPRRGLLHHGAGIMKAQAMMLARPAMWLASPRPPGHCQAAPARCPSALHSAETPHLPHPRSRHSPAASAKVRRPAVSVRQFAPPHRVPQLHSSISGGVNEVSMRNASTGTAVAEPAGSITRSLSLPLRFNPRKCHPHVEIQIFPGMAEARHLELVLCLRIVKDIETAQSRRQSRMQKMIISWSAASSVKLASNRSASSSASPWACSAMCANKLLRDLHSRASTASALPADRC